jgi:hypothetical protein
MKNNKSNKKIYSLIIILFLISIGWNYYNSYNLYQYKIWNHEVWEIQSQINQASDNLAPDKDSTNPPDFNFPSKKL